MEQPSVTLRPVEEEDLPLLLDLYSDPVKAGELSWAGFHTLVKVRQRFDEDGYLGEHRGNLVVLDAAGTACGSVGWFQIPTGPPPYSTCWNIGITLLPEHRGHGVGTAAQRALVDYLFAVTIVERIEASTDVENLAEQRALEKAGFTREGILRRAGWRDGAWRDMVLYSVLREEWNALRQRAGA